MEEISIIAPNFLQPNMKSWQAVVCYLFLKILFDIHPPLIVSIHYPVEVDIGFMGQKSFFIVAINPWFALHNFNHEIVSDSQICSMYWSIYYLQLLRKGHT